MRQVDPRRDLHRFADGRVWRLTRGRHFDGTVKAFRAGAKEMAADMGKVVRVARDKLQPDKYVWVQFGETQVGPGGRCVCGSREIVRIHENWARCRRCASLLGYASDVLEAEPDGGPLLAGADAAQSSERRRRNIPSPLDTFSDVRLYRYELGRENERCYGTATTPEATVALIMVDFPLDDGRRIPSPKTTGQWGYRLTVMPTDLFGAAIDLDLLVQGEPVSWRIAEDEGPEGPEILDPPLV